MTIPKLFLCHHRDEAAVVSRLARKLRLRGVVPWVDQEGGFSLGDGNAAEARRAIREDCRGLLLYATPGALERPFIRDVELDAAVRAKASDDRFVLVAVPCGIGFDELATLSMATIGSDLSQYASIRLEPAELGRGLDLQLEEVSRRVLSRVVADAAAEETPTAFAMQFSTREVLADAPDDILRVDATKVVGPSFAGACDAARWAEVHGGLLDVKRTVAEHLSRPLLRVHGRRHLTAGFLLGFVFPATTFAMEVRVADGYWASNAEHDPAATVDVALTEHSSESGQLHVELAVLGHDVGQAVRRRLRETGEMPLATLRLTVPPSERGSRLDNAAAVAVAAAVARAIKQTVATRSADEIHLFAAVPQGLATLIGHQLSALPPIQLYEFDGLRYCSSYVLNGANNR